MAEEHVLSETDKRMLKAVKKNDFEDLLHHPVVQHAPDKYKNDISMIRKIAFCRTTLKERVSMFDDLVKWHESYKPWEIQESEIATTLAAGAFFINGKDKMGRPILCIFGALHDPETRDLQETVRAIIYWVEKGISMMEPGVDQFVLIYDRTNVSSKHFDLQIVKEWGQIQNYYPLRLGRAMILHPNWMFHMSFKVCSVFLSEEALSKVFLCSDKNWKNELAEAIDRSNLLEVHGGTMKSPTQHLHALEGASGKHKVKKDEFGELEQQIESWKAEIADDTSREGGLLREAVEAVAESSREERTKRKKKKKVHSSNGSGTNSPRTRGHHDP